MPYRYNDNGNDGCGLVILMLALSAIISFIKLQPLISFLLLFILIPIFIYRKNIKYFFLTKEQKKHVNEEILKKEKEEILKKEKEKKRKYL